MSVPSSRRGRDRAAALSGRVTLPLVGIILAAIAFTGFWSLRVREWGVMTDELLYVKLALSLGDTFSPVPAIRGEYYAQFTPLYPLLIAPLYQLFDTTTAFRLAHGLNVLMMAGTAIPVYLLSRELSLPRIAGYCAGILAVFVPWVVFANQIATESVAYPAFALAVLAIVRATTVPSTKRDLLALGAIGLVTMARLQFAVLAAVLVAAIVIHELSYKWVSRPGDSAGPDRWVTRLARLPSLHPVLAVGVLACVFVLAALLVTGGVGRGLGNYESAVQGDLLPHGISRSIRAHVALLAAHTFVVPFVLAVAFGIAAVLRPANKAEHAFAVVLALTVSAVVFEAAHFNLRLTGIVQERYAFYVVAPVFVAMAAYLVRPRLPAVGLAAGALVVAWMLAKLDYAYETSYSFASPIVAVVQARAEDVGSVFGSEGVTAGDLAIPVTLLAAVALFVVTRLVPRNWGLIGVTAVVLVSMAVETTYNFNKIFRTQNAAQAHLGLDSPLARDRGLDWADDVLPEGASAAFVPAVVGSFEDTRKAWWDLEFWNKSVDRMYDYKDSWRDTPFPVEQLSFDWDSGALRVETPRRYLVLPRDDRRFRPVGKTLASTSLLELIEARLPLTVGWAVRGTDKFGWTTAGRPAVIRFYPGGVDPGRRVVAQIRLTSTPDVKGPRSYRILGGEREERGVVEPRQTKVVRVGFCSRREGTDLTVRVKGSTTLLSGSQVGLAVTGVRARTSGRCQRA